MLQEAANICDAHGVAFIGCDINQAAFHPSLKGIFPWLHPVCDAGKGQDTPVWATSSLEFQSRDCVGFLMLRGITSQWWNIASHGVWSVPNPTLGLGDTDTGTHSPTFLHLVHQNSTRADRRGVVGTQHREERTAGKRARQRERKRAATEAAAKPPAPIPPKATESKANPPTAPKATVSKAPPVPL